MKKSTRKLTIALVAIALVLGSAVGVLASNGSKTAELFYRDIKITLNGQSVIPKDSDGNTVEPFIIDGTTYLPVRGVAGILGLDVDWDGNTNTVILKEKSVETNAENSVTVKDDGSGTTERSDGMIKIPVLTDRNVNFTKTTGPIIYTINKIQISKLTATTDSAASTLRLEKNVEGSLIALDVTVENTSNDDIHFTPYMSTIVTNTKEQVSSNWILSDLVGGEFLGKVSMTGQIYFICTSSAEDLTQLQWRVDGPFNNNYSSVGNDVKIEINISK